MYKNEKKLPVSRIPCSGWPHTILSSVTSLSASSFLAYLVDDSSRPSQPTLPADPSSHPFSLPSQRETQTCEIKFCEFKFGPSLTNFNLQLAVKQEPLI